MSQSTEDSVPTRQSLLERLRRWDDTGAWRDFFATYWELIYNVARKAGLSDAESQDVVQETTIAVARRIGAFNTDPRRGSFKSWLFGQARWRIGDQFRARKRSLQGSGGAPDATAANPARRDEDETRTETLQHCPVDSSLDGFDTVWNQEWEQHVLRTATELVKAQVSVKQFQIFELHVAQGLSVADTAKVIGTTKAAVYMATSRVGRVLKREVHVLKIQ
jgi:RNA polymerase sigma-70 factor (ECF subfamily)